ncbi:hypothetical protein AQJ84_37565 [Streptomyces resistomycificus]|uniref:Uncharacterized protein n=1 Tax=Streptomyces resistomycificus TaxID=67356 RepID=A0A0L8KTK6_9ACTN|nr:hypothetical protein ADK37_37970 [Streptomyces resistomycificus]KUN90985.1 hypothetical protein AQJ84_37565 [Streptomyces resistomycificus]
MRESRKTPQSIDRPKATQNIRTGRVVSMEPRLVKPSRPDRWPPWKTQTTAPNIAVRLSALSTTARAVGPPRRGPLLEKYPLGV